MIVLSIFFNPNCKDSGSSIFRVRTVGNGLSKTVSTFNVVVDKVQLSVILSSIFGMFRSFFSIRSPMEVKLFQLIGLSYLERTCCISLHRGTLILYFTDQISLNDSGNMSAIICLICNLSSMSSVLDVHLVWVNLIMDQL